MLKKHKKLISLILAGLIFKTSLSLADIQDSLPEIGTVASTTLSINQEQAMGDFYSRQLRGAAPFIYDPLLVNYINTLGQRLVAHADSVKMPFTFYLINNNQINAFAFFGGNVVLHSGLFRETDNESQLASVMAHEISHVTQRHLARHMEEQSRRAPLTWASALGSMLLTMASPEAGMAALTTTLASQEQMSISFTQSNEQEADRIGLRILQRAGFSPQSMYTFMQKLADQYRYMSRPPEMLLTHPMPESRISDMRNRVNQLSQKKVASSQDYLLAKFRIAAMYDTSRHQDQYLQVLIDQYAKGDNKSKIAAQYGQAVNFYQKKNYIEARKIIQSLLQQQPNNMWFIDLITDIDLASGNKSQAVSRLEQARKNQPNNAILQINLANAYIESGQAAKATTLLNRYTFEKPNDINGWSLLETASVKQGHTDEALAARSELFALNGQLEQAIASLVEASREAKLGSMQQARYDARIDQLRQMQKRYRQYEHN